MHQEGCNDRYRLAPEKDVIVAQKQIWELQMMSTVATEPLASWWLKKKFVSEQEVHACTWEDVEHLNASESALKPGHAFAAGLPIAAWLVRGDEF